MLHKRQKYYIIISLLIGILLIISYILIRKDTTLIDLQHRVVSADSAAEREKIIDGLYTYYSRLSVADSIVQAVSEKAASKLEDSPYNSSGSRGSTYRNAHEYSQWLQADAAEALCRANHLDPRRLAEAEMYAAYGLQLLREVPDERLRLRIAQRIQTMLYLHRSLFDLSFALAEHEIRKAEKMKFHLRQAGLTYNYANALRHAGLNDSALVKMQEVLRIVEKHKHIPDMSWYEKNVMLTLIMIYWELVRYDLALQTCKKVEKFDLKQNEFIEYLINKAVVHKYIGDIDMAESLYKQALTLSRENGNNHNRVGNMVTAMQNLGMLYHQMSEYDLALSLMDSALTILEYNNPDNIELRSKSLIEIAELMAARKDIEKYNRYIAEAEALVGLSTNPYTSVQLLKSIGSQHLHVHSYHKAEKSFEQALELCKKYGLFRASLEAQINYARSLIYTSQLEKAEQLLLSSRKNAEQKSDDVRMIDCIALLMDIAMRRANVKDSNKYSNDLVCEIKNFNMKFTSADNLTLFRQRIHNYLTQVVLNEINQDRIDSAFVKLDYFKAIAFKSSLMEENPVANNNILNSYIDIKAFQNQLSRGELLLSYIVTDSNVYVFSITQESLKLYQNHIKYNETYQLKTSFLSLIKETIQIFTDYNAKKAREHFSTLSAVNKKLSSVLLGMTGLEQQIRNADITYIVPDDWLYHIPFSCLSTHNGYFVQNSAVVTLPEASCLMNSSRSPLNKSDKILLSIDNRFRGAREFANFIKGNYTNVTELRIDKREITSQDIIAQLGSKYDIFTIIGHGKSDIRNPKKSTIQINVLDLNNEIRTCNLSLPDLRKINWHGVKLAALIGCETGTGKIYKGTGASGLQQCLLSSGADEVIASLWAVDASTSIDLMSRFFRLKKKYRNSAIALQQAQIESINELEKSRYFQGSHPYFWGGFTITQKSLQIN
ncbi:MAG: CHAT domain-containing tetratricopeptide repeat protein [candidate division KSB1 bacterium]|jgi:CHAT domain-containing protein|nr:CHAT domain-containing tetratricopeptide repeat protein [candidate division KSB1 bacterium]